MPGFDQGSSTIVFGCIPARIFIQMCQFAAIVLFLVNGMRSKEWTYGALALVQVVLLFGFVYRIRKLIFAQFLILLGIIIYIIILMGIFVFANNETESTKSPITTFIGYLSFLIVGCLLASCNKVVLDETSENESDCLSGLGCSCV